MDEREIKVHTVGLVVFVYFLLEDKQMTEKRRGRGKISAQGKLKRLDKKSQSTANRSKRSRLVVWSASPVSVLMWVYAVSVENESVGTAEI